MTSDKICPRCKILMIEIIGLQPDIEPIYNVGENLPIKIIYVRNSTYRCIQCGEQINEHNIESEDYYPVTVKRSE